MTRSKLNAMALILFAHYQRAVSIAGSETTLWAAVTVILFVFAMICAFAVSIVGTVVFAALAVLAGCTALETVGMTDQDER